LTRVCLGLRSCLASVALILGSPGSAAPLDLPRLPDAQPRNIIFVLTDDHRYDALGFLNHPFVETPNLDRLAREGVHCRNAFVCTALCSPSRASILTGLYTFKHRVVDNNNPVPPGTLFFSQYLQQAGYETAFIGKWHMGGEGDEPQPGFDHWVSFRGQGTYLPSRNGLNVDGRRVPQKGYITDELTDYALDWLKRRRGDKPFMLYLSHKAVHADFVPAARHRGRYRDKVFVPPPTQADTATNYAGKPLWVRNQRNSWHGVDFPYHGGLKDIGEFYRGYCEALLAVDESVGRLLEWLRAEKLLDRTLVVYLGDNGFLFGEHGLIDKRVAYEESIRVPLLMRCPELFKAGTVVEQMVANIDLAPTFLAAAGLQPPANLDGANLIPLARGQDIPWRQTFLYVYYWEKNFPQTPTVHAIRTDQFKYIHYYGVWDTDELYQIRDDPQETRNLIRDPAFRDVARQLNQQLFAELERRGGLYIPLYPDRGGSQNLRSRRGAVTADFPDYFHQD
jgi:N-acetylglucosamine-6-sulfatase